MKNVSNLSGKLFLLFILPLLGTNCTTDEPADSQSKNTERETTFYQKGYLGQSYNDYLSEAYEIKDLLDSLTLEAKNITFNNDEEITDYLLSGVKNLSLATKLPYLSNPSLPETKGNIEDLKAMGLLSDKAIYYFEALLNMVEVNDFSNLQSLLDSYKLDYDNDASLESLAGIFTTIEVYLLEYDNVMYRGCRGNFNELMDAVVDGAIIGAIDGGIGGSFLGPAGTIGGLIGGGIFGGIIGGLYNIGKQAIKNCP